jgi:SsrA-binding protein
MSLVVNKKATFDYALLESIEAGVELLGTEAKSIRAKHGSLSGAYVAVLSGEVYLLGAHIPPWQEKNVSETYDPYRSRKLLLKKKEIMTLEKALHTKGLTVIPISLYSKGRYIKAQIAIAKGKKNFDKRDVLKKKDLDREARRGE